MNQRIKELAVNAGFQSYITTHEEDVAMFEKFAKLIAKECAKLCADESERMYSMSNDDLAWKMDDASTMILEHFGVEE